jgi:uncharacterized protein YjbI with pentapeptide repeats
MANEQQVEILKKGVKAWNSWYRKSPSLRPDFHELAFQKANLRGAILADADFSGANLSRAILREADLRNADFRGANLHKADLREADLHEANLIKADLTGADLTGADLTRADLTKADLTRATLKKAYLPEATIVKAELIKVDLSAADLGEATIRWVDMTGAKLTEANLTGARVVGAYLNSANLSNCQVYGISAWDLRIDKKTRQHDLVITPSELPAVTVDSLEIAQFIYLLLKNKNIRNVIETVGKKAVLILGRFTPKRMVVLDALRQELRTRNYLPIVFDFEKPANRDLSETITTLAYLARFVIADITDAKSIPQELQRIVPCLPSLPIQPIILASQYVYSMFKDFGAYLSVLPLFRYKNIDHLLASLDYLVVAPAVNQARKIEQQRKKFEHSLNKP